MKKIIPVIILVVLGIGAFFGYRFYKSRYGSNVPKEKVVLIPTKANFSQVMDSVRTAVDNPKTFEETARAKHMDKYFHGGRYIFKAGANNTDLVNMIKAGNQTPNTFRIGDFYDVYQMLGRVARKTEVDSLAFAVKLNEIAKNKGLENAESLKPYFFSDTYEFFWTVTPQEFFKKFEDQYNEYWTSERRNLQEQSGLSREQIYALASIVFKESGGKKDEMPTIAGLYLNRYRKGMKLQSDPTVIYAVNRASGFDQKIKRVLYKHLRTENPYNTYIYPGIPPGPICIVDKASVDAVLHAEKNDYIYMAANPQKPGYHNFTASSAEHMANAKKYQDWLNSKNIKK